MKYVYFALIAALLVAGCTAAPSVNTGQQAAPDDSGSGGGGNIITGPTYCSGLSIKLSSPSNNELINGGFRAAWTIENAGGVSYTNKDETFVIYMKPTGGSVTDLKTLKGVYGEAFNQDITFLQQVTKGNYVVGVRGSMSDCTIPSAEVPVRVG